MTLDEIVRSYYTNKVDYDALKKIVDGENAKIKEMMLNENITTFEVDDIVAEYSVSIRDNINESKMLDIIKKYESEIPVTLIKTVEIIDSEALEQALYHDVIPDSIKKELAECNTPKEVVTLRVKKAKASKKKLLNE